MAIYKDLRNPTIGFLILIGLFLQKFSFLRSSYGLEEANVWAQAGPEQLEF